MARVVGSLVQTRKVNITSDGSAERQFTLRSRIPPNFPAEYPVAIFKPIATSVFALDISPLGNPDPASNGMVCWLHVCSRDPETFDGAFITALAGISKTGDALAQFGSQAFNGGVAPPVEIVAGTQRLGGFYPLTIADDHVATIPLKNAVAKAIINCIDDTITDPCPRGELWLRGSASNSTILSHSMLSETNIGYTAGALTGTTGTDGNFTFSVAGQKLYLENRSGVARNFVVSVLG